MEIDIAKRLSHMGKIKKYILPSGRVIYYRGYENFALDYFHKESGFTEDEIVSDLDGTHRMPRIPYIFKGVCRKYTPDIYIPSLKIFIEVKSVWTYESELAQNWAKHIACKEAGYEHQIWIYDGKGNCIEPIIDNITQEQLDELLRQEGYVDPLDLYENEKGKEEY